MFVGIDITITISAVLIALLMYKYMWFARAFDLFEQRPAAYKNPMNFQWWYVGNTCRTRK